MVNLLTVLRWLNAIAKRSNLPPEQLRTCCTFRQNQLDIKMRAVARWPSRGAVRIKQLNRGLARRPGGFAPSLFFHVDRAAMHHFEVVPVAAIWRTIFGCGREPVRIGQVTVSVVRIEHVAAMDADLDLCLGSHTSEGTRDRTKLCPKTHGIRPKLVTF